MIENLLALQGASRFTQSGLQTVASLESSWSLLLALTSKRFFLEKNAHLLQYINAAQEAAKTPTEAYLYPDDFDSNFELGKLFQKVEIFQELSKGNERSKLQRQRKSNTSRLRTLVFTKSLKHITRTHHTMTPSIATEQIIIGITRFSLTNKRAGA